MFTNVRRNRMIRLFICISIFIFSGMTLACTGSSHPQDERARASATTPEAGAIGKPTRARNETEISIRSAKELENRAIAVAKKWKEDAYLTTISFWKILPSPAASASNSSRVSYSFHSWSDISHEYVIDFSADDTIHVRDWTLGFPSVDYVPIEPIDWMIDSRDAWRIALENGGGDFSLKYGLAPELTVIHLERWDPPRSGVLYWYIVIVDAHNQRNFRIYIDAKTGAVVKKELY